MFRKLLREDQLEPVTKAAQQEELERRKRLEQQRKDYAAPIPTVPLEFLPGERGGGRKGPALRGEEVLGQHGGQGHICKKVVTSRESFQVIQLLRAHRRISF